MDLKLPDITQYKKKNNNNQYLEELKPKKQSNLSSSASYAYNPSPHHNNIHNRHLSISHPSKESLLFPSKSFQLEDYEHEDILKSVLKRFSLLEPSVRHDFLLKIFKDCNPDDMTYIYKTLPTLHRDFLSLLPKSIAYEIIVYTSPRDINTFAQVSKNWRELITHVELWERLYDNIGLKSMYKNYLCKSITLNCIKLSLLTNWVKGKFHYNSIQAHTSGILQMCLYGDYLATAGADRTCKLYDIVSGTCLKVFNGHEKCILCVKMDSKKVITGSEDHTIRLWNIRTGEEIVKLNDHKGSVNSVAFYDTTLISGSSDNTIKIWKMESVKVNVKKNSLLNKNTLEYNVVCLRTLFGHTASVQCVDTLPTVCVSGSSDGTIRLWHVESGNCIKIIYPSLLKSIPIYKMCPELTKVEEILYEPISCIKLTYNYLVAGTYSGHIYLIDIYAKEITADDVFRPEWTNWKKKNLDVVEAEENGNIINFITSFNQQVTNQQNQSKTKPSIIDDFSVPCNILTIRGREFAYEELIDWVNTPTNLKLNKIYNLDVNAIPISPEYSYEDLKSMENTIEKQKEMNNNQNYQDEPNSSDNANSIINYVKNGDNPNKNSSSNNNINDENIYNKLQYNDGNPTTEEVSLDKKKNLSMMDMSDFMNHQSLSNSHLNQSYYSKDDDISAFERQISMNCDYFFSKESINEDSEKPSMIPKRTTNDKLLKSTSNTTRPRLESISHSINEKTNIPKRASISIPSKKTISNNEKLKPTSKKSRKRRSKANEKISLDNYIYTDIDDNQKNSNENMTTDKTVTESTNEIKNDENEKEPTKLEKSNENINSPNAENNKSTSKIEKYLKERYSNNDKNNEIPKKPTIINNRRFKLEVSSAKWILGVQVDAWRLIAGGCEGRSIFWNHKIGTPIFEINKDTTNIVTIPTIHAKKRKRKQKSKYNKSNDNHTTIIGGNNDNNNNQTSNNNENNENNGDNIDDINETNDIVIPEKSVIDPEKIHSFVYVPGKDQPITDVIFNERFLIISDIKGKLRIWEVHDFV